MGARLAASACRSFQTSVLLILWTGEWGQGNGRIFGSSVRDESLCLVLPTGLGTYVPLNLSLRYPRDLNLVDEAMTCSTISGRRPEQPVLFFAPFPFSPQCNLWPFPCPRTSTLGCVRCGAMFERVCSRPQSKTCGKKASPLKAGRSPRGFCLQVFANFCASRSLDRGMGTREWSNLRFIRSR